MSFIFNLAWRELRASWRRLLFFFLCVGIGVGSIVALGAGVGDGADAAVAPVPDCGAGVLQAATAEMTSDRTIRVRVMRPPIRRGRRA